MEKGRGAKRSNSLTTTNTRIGMLSKEFFESKVNALLDYWKGNEAFGWGGNRCDSVNFIHLPTQTYETESGGIRFILWNLIRGFSGHYECVVDTNTFNYSVKQHSDYGSLTWTAPAKDHKVYKAEDLSDVQKLEIEASIALTVIKCYFTDDSWGRINVVDKSLQRHVWNRVTSDNLLMP